MNEDFNEYAYILNNIIMLGNRGKIKLIEAFGSEKDIFLATDAAIKSVLSDKEYLIFKDGIKRINVNDAVERMEKKNVRFTSITSEKYPEKLRNIPNPPHGLYYIGNLPNEDYAAVAMIGSRQCSEYGVKVAKTFGRELAEAGINIISGMARGVDSISQAASISAGGKTYAILGSGVDVCYPRENEGVYYETIKHGGVISEYAMGTAPQKYMFPERNRIISGLSDVVLVVEARKRSGTYITVTQALEQGRDVYAVPGRITDSLSDGCNSLVNEGAGIALSSKVIIEALSAMGRVVTTQRPDSMKDGASKEDDDEIMKVIDITPITFEKIMQRLSGRSIDYSEIVYRLTLLEVQGKVKKIGNSYIKL